MSMRRGRAKGQAPASRRGSKLTTAEQRQTWSVGRTGRRTKSTAGRRVAGDLVLNERGLWEEERKSKRRKRVKP